MSAVKGARVFQFNEPGSKILREWNEARARHRLITARGRADMTRDWASGVAGISTAGFAGAGVNRLTQSLAQWSGSINADLDGNLSLLRSRARQLCQNNEFGRRFLSLVANNVIGKTGPVLQVRATDQSGKLDKVANDAIEVAYAQWSQRADVRGLMSLGQLQRVGIKAAARDGEALIRIVRNKSLTHGIGLQLLEADRIADDYNTELSNGNVVRMGVEVNSLLQPVALWLKARHPGDNRQQGNARTDRVGINDVLHVYLPERAEQVRGYTWLHAVLIRMNMLHAYEEAAVVAARVGAAKMGVFQRAQDAPAALGQLADGKDAAGVPTMSAEPGEFMELPQGWELHNWDPEYPQANFESFLKACFRGVAAGLDVAAHNLTGDMTDVNYSSARIAELAERDAWEVLQQWWIHSVSMPIYRAWLESALLRADIRFPDSGKALPATRLQKFIDAGRFQPRTWKWVDPAKEITALKEEIALGINSRTAVAASQGREFEDVVDELRQEAELLQAAGLSATVTTGSAPQPAAPKPDASGDDSNDDDADEAAAAAEEDRSERRAMIAALVRIASTDSQPPQLNIAEGAIQIKAGDTHVTVPEREVHLEATLETPSVTVNTARTTETVPERDENNNIVRTVTREIHE